MQEQPDSSFPCYKCKRGFKTHRGLMQHLRQCKESTPYKKKDSNAKENNSAKSNHPTIMNLNLNLLSDESTHENSTKEKPPIEKIEKFFLAKVKGSEVIKCINYIYDNIVFWKRNLFMLPNGSVGNNYIRELTRLFQIWNDSSPMSCIAIKAIHVMPSLLLQKPSKTSKAKDHVLALMKRLELWHQGEFEQLFHESRSIQSTLKTFEKKKDISFISKRFAELMHKGNVNGAMKTLTDNLSGGILPLDDKTLDLLIQKHP